MSATVVIQSGSGQVNKGSIVTFAHPFGPEAKGKRIVAHQVKDGRPLPTQDNLFTVAEDGSQHAILTVRTPDLVAGERVNLDLRVSDENTTLDSFGHVSDLTDSDLDVGISLRDTDGKRWEWALSREGVEDFRNRRAERIYTGRLAREWLVMGPLRDSSGMAHHALTVECVARYYGSRAARFEIAICMPWPDALGDETFELIAAVRDGQGVGPRRVRYHPEITIRNGERFDFGCAAGELIEPMYVGFDSESLALTGATPRYDPNLTINSAVLKSHFVNKWNQSNKQPLRSGFVRENMTNTGGRDDIGLLPRWAATFILTGWHQLWDLTVDCSRRGGSFPVHYLDRSTWQPIMISKASGFSTPPFVNGFHKNHPDCAHMPCLDYPVYLLSGSTAARRRMVSWSNWILTCKSGRLRSYADGLFAPSEQVRGVAWDFRTLGASAWILPEGHPFKAEFSRIVQNNIRWMEANVVGSNPFGYWRSVHFKEDELHADDIWETTSAWNSDFVISALGWLKAMGYSVETVARWLAKWPCEWRYGGEGKGWPRIDASPFNIATARVTEWIPGQEGRQPKTMVPLTTHEEFWRYSFANRFTDDGQPAPPGYKVNKGPSGYHAYAKAAASACIDFRAPGARDAFDWLAATLYGESDDPSFAIVSRG